MRTFNAIEFLKLMDKAAMTAEKPSYFSLAHGFSFLSKPFLVAKFRKLLRYVAVLGNNLFDSEAVKGVPDSMRGTADQGGNLVRVEPLSVFGCEPFSVIKQGMVRTFFAHMPSHVGPVGKHDEVFWPVIKGVAVDVVNLFVRFKIAAKNLFHHKTMFKNILGHASRLRMIRALNSPVAVSIATANNGCSAIPFPVIGTLVRRYRKSALLFHSDPPCYLVSYFNMRDCNMSTYF